METAEDFVSKLHTVPKPEPGTILFLEENPIAIWDGREFIVRHPGENL